MKKSIIATGAASLALAAMPVLGAFANVTDTVTLTIDSSCSVGATTATTGAGANLSEDHASINTKYTFDADGEHGGTIKVTCNDASGWQVKAVGSSAGADNTVMVPTGSGTAIATGTAESGATSNWMMKVAGVGVGSTTPAVNDFASWHAVPSSATKVAAASGAISEGAINTGYQVWVGSTQEADTYTGSVTYTVTTGTN